MPDISMCSGGTCPKQDTCYRKTAIANLWRQSYFCSPPVKEDGTCSHYWDDVEERKYGNTNSKEG